MREGREKEKYRKTNIHVLILPIDRASVAFLVICIVDIDSLDIRWLYLYRPGHDKGGVQG